MYKKLIVKKIVTNYLKRLYFSKKKKKDIAEIKKPTSGLQENLTLGI